MTVLTLTSAKRRPLRPLVEAALENQLRLLHAGIARTEERLRAFEADFGLSSASAGTRTTNCPKR